MSRSLTGWQAVVLGVVVVAGVALGLAGLFAVGGRGWYGSQAFHVRAAFREIKGIDVGARVRIKGMDAGEVAAVLPPEKLEDPVVLRLVLRGDYRNLVRPNAVVRFDTDGLVGGKVLEIVPGLPASDAALEEDQLLQGESADLMDQLATTLGGVRDGKGSLGKFVSDDKAHEAFVQMMQQGTRTLQKSEEAIAAMQQDAEALKRLPLVGGYVEDPSALLERYNCQRDRRFFAAAELFEPGKAVLSAAGRKRLDELAPWLKGIKNPNSDIVVVAYADASAPYSPSARALTRQQSEAVCDYLKSKHAVQKLGWFSSRKVTALGLGVSPPPMAETEALPPDRVEVQVYTP